MFFVYPTIVANTKELINTIPNIAAEYEAYFRQVLLTINSSTWPAEVKETIMREISIGARTLQVAAVAALKRGMTSMLDIIFSLFDIVLAMIIAYYYLKDADYLKEGFLSLMPRKWRNFLIGTGREINLILSNFIQGQLLTALIVGIMESIGLMLIHAKYPVVMGMVGGIFNIIPYFGPFLGAIPAVAVSLIDSPLKALWTALVFTIVQQIDNAFISPKIIEGRLGLHPVTTILAVLVGGEFAGILGMLVAVPIAAIVKVIIKRTIDIIV
jgi:predicted PurR-regulated permease PerM